MKPRSACRDLILLLLLNLMAGTPTRAQTYTVLANFDASQGVGPISVVQGRDGNLYGDTYAGGETNCQVYGEDIGCGTSFQLTPSGQLTLVHKFGCDGCDLAGDFPETGLILGTDGNFYGMGTLGGGEGCFSDYCGTIFKLTPTGNATLLYLFCAQQNCPDGSDPNSLLQAPDGNFYGTTGQGTVFKMTPEGNLSVIHTFCQLPNCLDGAYPAGLVLGKNGSFYGTTSGGGAYGLGTIFKLTPKGTLKVLHDFHNFDGNRPIYNMIEAADGSFYGITQQGGSENRGTVFKITSEGIFTSLYNFCSQDNCTDGAWPNGTLTQATDGNFYGTTQSGGDPNCYQGCGTIFKITPKGVETVLHEFDDTTGSPGQGLFQATNGILYGGVGGGDENSCGEFYSCGTMYSLDVGLGPFVAFVRDSGKVDEVIQILGQGFTGTTGVSLSGISAQFQVVSDTFLKAKVPAGATTGFVTVTTPSVTLSSNKPFRVLPQVLSFNPPSGPVGTQVTITGVSLAQTLGVGFGVRVPAQFTVVSDTQVTATVPGGAKTGKIGVETHGGVAISSGTFTVSP